MTEKSLKRKKQADEDYQLSKNNLDLFIQKRISDEPAQKKVCVTYCIFETT